MKPAILLLILGLVGCATIQSSSQIDPKILHEFTSRGVSSVTVFKVREGLPLTVDQVAECVKKGVPGPGLVSYLQSTRKAYQLSRADVTKLRAAGASDPLLNYMQRSAEYYTTGPKAVSQKHPYFNEERNNLEAPFAYAPPMADTFFNSSYEENLYSPFSFD
ncbi:MAG: hypothetical protein ACOYOL_11185 [Chthoniobacterales bacterium]|jgi:hypothetical protein